MPTLSSMYNEATWSTDRYFSKKVTDNFFTAVPITYMLRKGAETIGGGESLEISMIFDDADGEWFSEWDTYTATFKEQLSAARLEWKYYTVPVVMSNAQLLKNSESPERRYKLAMNKNIVAAKSAASDFETALFSTTFTSGGEPIDSLDLAIGTASYAGITRTSGAGTVFAGNVDSTTTVLSLSAIQTNFGTATQGAERPNLICTTQTNYNRIFDLYTPVQRIGSDELGKLGFTSLMFSMAPVVVSSKVNTTTNHYLYGLNMNHIQLVAHRDAFFSFEKYVVPSNQWVSIGRYFLMGNVLCHAPRYQFKMTALTA